MSKYAFVGCLLLVCAAGCNRSEQEPGARVEPSPAATAETPPAAPAEPSLVAVEVVEPPGIVWEASTVSGLAGVKVPTGEGWASHPMGMGAQYENETSGIVVMLQQQPGVPAEARDEFVDSFVQVNERDAPRYGVTERKNGTVNGHAAARVDGRFDNGTAMVTRDLVVFVNGKAVATMVRGPEARSAEVQQVADYVARSIR